MAAAARGGWAVLHVRQAARAQDVEVREMCEKGAGQKDQQFEPGDVVEYAYWGSVGVVTAVAPTSAHVRWISSPVRTYCKIILDLDKGNPYAHNLLRKIGHVELPNGN